MTGGVLKRSAGARLAPFFAIIIAAQLMFRPHGWRFEWIWSSYQYGFYTVLLCPAVAAAGAWEGVRLARQQAGLRTVPRQFRAGLAAWAGVVSWTSACYVAGQVVAWLMVAANGTPGQPGLLEFEAMAAPLAFLAVGAAAGMALGRILGSWIALPGAAVLIFLATLYLYTAGPIQYVTVGGATGSMTGLAPNRAIQIAQVAFFAGATGVLLALTILQRPVGRYGWAGLPAATVIVTAAVAVGTAVDLNNAGFRFLNRVPVAVTCRGSNPAICTAPAYLRFAAKTHRLLAPYVDELRKAGVTPLPAAFSQNQDSTIFTIGPLDVGTLRNPQRDVLPQLVTHTYESSHCATAGVPGQAEAYVEVEEWLAARVDHSTQRAPFTPEVLLTGSEEEQFTEIRRAVSLMMACSKTFPSDQ